MYVAIPEAEPVITPELAEVVRVAVLIDSAETSMTDKVLLGLVSLDNTLLEALTVAAMASWVSDIDDEVLVAGEPVTDAGEPVAEAGEPVAEAGDALADAGEAVAATCDTLAETEELEGTDATGVRLR